VRTLAAFSLIGLLTLCPLICGAEEIAGGAHRHRPAGGPAGNAPSHCPEEGDNCICQGAIPLDEVRTPAQDSGAIGLRPLLGPCAQIPRHPIAHLTWSGSPTGLAGWGDAVAVRSFLQNFRC
jgi:hypothetical protein